jgi:hypothetical protein
MDKLKWEEIASNTYRLKVYGGWIVYKKTWKEHTWGGGASDAVALGMVFVPDPNHEWMLGHE